jgi:hypothetical protein
MSFKDYYKFPLFKEEEYQNVYTSDGNHAFEFPYIEDSAFFIITDSDQQLITNVINGCDKLSHFYVGHFEYKNGDILLDGRIIITVRGWGMLTGIGAYNLSAKLASKIQDEFGQYITDKLNAK